MGNGSLLRLCEAITRPGILLRIALTLTFLAYLRTIAYDFVYDDYGQIALNPWLTSWSGLKDIFTQHSWAFASPEMPARYYRPIYLVWLWAIRMLTDGAPGWFHLAAILTHLGVCCLVFLLSRRLLREERAAAIATLLFALHPSKIEAVAWIAGATEVVHAAFFLGMFVAYFRWRERSGWPWLAISVGCFAGALLAKETAVVGPPLILLYEWMSAGSGSRERSFSPLAVLAAPFASVMVAYAVLRRHVLGGMGDLDGTVSMIKTVYTAPLAVCWYLKQLILPFRLSLFYPEMILRRPELIRFAGASALLAIIAIACWVWAKGSAEMKFLGLWLAATLAPPVGAILLLQPHDRYLYLPSFAFAVILAKLLSRLKTKHLATFAAALSLLFATTTFVEEQYWETERQIFARATEIAPDLPKAWELLATTYHGQQEVEILRSAYSKSPQNARLAYALGEAYSSQGDLGQAQVLFKRALETCRDDRLVHVDSLHALARIAEQQHKYADAEQLLRDAANTPKTPELYRFPVRMANP